MTTRHLPSRFFTTGLLLALLLTVLNWGFRQAPDAARQQLLVEVEDAMEEPTVAVEPVTFFIDHCIQRPRPELPPVEEMTLPIYPGCELEADYEERVFCGFGRLKHFIDKNQVQPEGSKRERVGISFVIQRQTGLMQDFEVIAGEDQRNIREALRIVKLMVDRGVRWTPGTVEGEAVNFPLAIPISFHGAGCGE
ncbi:hypothetical protein LEM8419_02203 [Neolewinella maritima]|uniref:TonB C-terminal domain-containing protein n=1 Tax=Neolewinella maritima TaxID=1383882 RepID=A0ABM9B1S9_9BACT|nr:energy transducer TonB [Neolewinella maritima]CAH1001302.1 hypothetical protein LEM8419_02203 [Neolewinella maritima]